MKPGHDPARLREALATAAPHLNLSFRSMFGGIFAYLDGRPFASLSDRGLAFKLTGRVHADALAEPGTAPLRYEPNDPPSKSCVLVPEAALAVSETLRDWANRAAAALPATKPKAR